MKLISLNIWGAQVYEPLMAFLKLHAADTDIFCFQEVLIGGKGQTSRGEMKSLYEDISNILINHSGYFSEYGEGSHYGESSKNLDFKFGIAIFAKKEHKQSFVESTALYDSDKKLTDYSCRFAAGVSMAVLVLKLTIINVHGLWQESGKKDTEARLEQSQRIIDLASKTGERKIICGDFNLLPNTESIAIIERTGMRNLIKEYGITSTRSPLYRHYTDAPLFADYTFVSPDIKVQNFEVLQDLVSDHLPMMLEFA